MDGEQTLPRHRAAILDDTALELHRRVTRVTEALELLRRRVDVLGSKICGLPGVLAHWQAQDPELAAELAAGGPDLSPAELGDVLLDRYLSAAETSWRGMVDSATEPDDDWDGDEGLFPEEPTES